MAGTHRTSKALMIALYEFGRLLELCLLTSGKVLKSPGVEFWSICTYSLWERVKATIPFCRQIWQILRGWYWSNSEIWLCKLLACSCCDLHWHIGCVNASEHMQGWIRTTIEVPCFCLGQGCQRLAEQWCVKNITNCMGMGHVYSTASPAENAGSVQSTQAGLWNVCGS